MTIKMRDSLTLLVACAAAAASACGGGGPSQVLDRYLAALGGESAVRRPQAATTRSRIEVRPGVVLEQVQYRTGGRSLTVTTLPGGTTVRAGFDGERGWQIDPAGARLLNEPAGSLRRDADIAYAANVLKSFKKMTTVGVEEFGGRPCYHLRGTTNWGAENHQFYDTTTGLLAGYRFRSSGSRDTAVVTMLFSDFRSFGAALIPTHIVWRQGSQTIVASVVSESYEPIAPSTLATPDTILSLLTHRADMKP